MKTVKKIFNTIVSLILVATFVLAGYTIFNVVKANANREVPQVFGISLMKVATGSMEPTIPTNSLIVIKKTDPSEIKVGDVICFYSSDPKIEGLPNTHRVIEVENENGRYVFTTQGDASEIPDEYKVDGNRLVGRFVKSFQAEKILKVMQSQYFFFFALLIPLCVVIFFEFLHVKKVIAQKKEDKENAKGNKD